MVDERDQERQFWDAPRLNTRRGLKRQSTDLAHSRHKKAGIEAANHVAPVLVLARAQVAAVENAGVGVDAPTGPKFQTCWAPERG